MTKDDRRKEDHTSDLMIRFCSCIAYDKEGTLALSQYVNVHTEEWKSQNV